ncbi:acyl-CoA/acyl-ACP dehydrogenase [Rhodococcus sp. ZPP]|uniref:acyl-CoA dehydrogenase family protein n=1 Tax=Rhodococcus sp. ZPP TaxID=2749906 RepID=UPI001AD86996|nr:acyl-CoA dehydrogenase family protein [Rhodococcus sp. ZPP]QTJ68605.1 acyl-CoA/acyl-ACP dehydrogenase [Rhodococcus sp. ZPP]
MSIIFDQEQQALREATRQFFTEQFSSDAIRSQMATSRGFEDKVWLRMATELGLQGLALPEEYGGAGAGFVEQLVVLEEMGRAVVGSPYFSTVALAANALTVSGDAAAQKELLPGIADGSMIATLSFLDASGAVDVDGHAVVATTSPDGFVLDGRGYFVSDGHVADKILVVAATAAGTSLFVVDTQWPGVTAAELDTLDQTRKQAHLTFEQAPAVLVSREGGGSEIVERTLDLARIALAAEQLGGAQRCLDMSVEYATMRSQFGRKIGSFQAVKHRCADMLIAIEAARSAVYHAVQLAADPATADSNELRLAAPMAKALASEAYMYAARQNIQLHGGIGCTWEHDAHLYYRRAHASTAFLGGIEEQRERLATRLGI